MTQAEKIEKMLNEQSTSEGAMKVDPEFSHPYGMGYDHIIKEKASMAIDNKKLWNNQLMDHLV